MATNRGSNQENTRPVKINPEGFSRRYVDVASYLLIASLALVMLFEHLVPMVLVGFVVYGATQHLSIRLARYIPKLKAHHAKAVALALILLLVTMVTAMVGLVAFHFMKSQSDGLGWLLRTVADNLSRMRASLPDAAQAYVPDGADELKQVAVEQLKRHANNLSGVGVHTLHTAAHLIMGLVAGAMLAWAKFGPVSSYPPLSASLLTRFTRLRNSFEQVVFAQAKISAVNSALTAIFLLIVLPLFGIHLPLAKTLVVITFLVGLMPVVGNLVSNSLIVIIGLGVSLPTALACLVFLIVIHKLEYLLNSQIIGHSINARAWELILAMLLMESLFGLEGLVCAPVLYAYLKAELLNAKLVGGAAGAHG